ncbi:aminopeptidase NAALADL1 [Protopterus annectens]|uniref:aminopeptidase NAALADL1 n=1 Tax=Protopterus annectens TaxID=7888 RepID=UPI001CFB05E5|nr:aminopeptidase NAALADL1 [Protopterus annectens]
MNTWLKVLIGVLSGAAVFTAGILIGHYGMYREPSWAKGLIQDVDESLLEQFMKEIDNKKIEENLRALTKKPHMATQEGDNDLVNLILERWKDPNSGLDEAKKDTYDVYLSFPDAEKPNNVAVVQTNGTTIFTTRIKEKNYTADQLDMDVVQPYAAYGPAGNPKGKLVFANQGKISDFEYLSQSINLTGTIAIVRYGGAGRGAKAINAAKFGVIGIIIYTDPKEMNDGKVSETETYPNSWYLPPSGVERGSFNGYFGDLLTPYYPAKEFTYRMDESEIRDLPPIATQPIGFEDAKTLICALSGADAPSDWQGGLGCTYKVGPGFMSSGLYSGSDVQVNVYNKAMVKKSDNVMGIIQGSVEPDRYVIYGNHRDSWVHGAIDPSSGTAVMLEISRVLGKMVKTGKWRPRRTIIFGSWGAEEFGLIGSVEYTEEYYSLLRERTVAYINVDISVFANATFSAGATPPVQNVIFTSAKQVTIPGDKSTSVYENWKKYSNRTSSVHGLIPRIGNLGAGSDYASFIHYLGITSMDLSYTYDKSKTSARIYPAYHTAYDTFDYAARFIDPGFTSHQTVGRTAGNILLRLADSLIIPFDVTDYTETLEAYVKTASESFGTVLSNKNISLAPINDALAKFKTAASNLKQKISELKNLNEIPLTVRRINDQLMLLERAFLDHRAFPEKYYYSHVIWASKTSSVPTFPGLADAFAKAEETKLDDDWKQVNKHVTIIVQAIESAAHILEVVAYHQLKQSKENGSASNAGTTLKPILEWFVIQSILVAILKQLQQGQQGPEPQFPEPQAGPAAPADADEQSEGEPPATGHAGRSAEEIAENNEAHQDR